jgi:hypothetical protein
MSTQTPNRTPGRWPGGETPAEPRHWKAWALATTQDGYDKCET